MTTPSREFDRSGLRHEERPAARWLSPRTSQLVVTVVLLSLSGVVLALARWRAGVDFSRDLRLEVELAAMTIACVFVVLALPDRSPTGSSRRTAEGDGPCTAPTVAPIEAAPLASAGSPENTHFRGPPVRSAR